MCTQIKCLRSNLYDYLWTHKPCRFIQLKYSTPGKWSGCTILLRRADRPAKIKRSGKQLES